jgi:endonuclease YncB( thermonuclease family)
MFRQYSPMIRRRSRVPRGSLASLLVAVALAVASVVLVRPESRPVEGRAVVVDGDSLRLGGADIRLKGIDAPELRQTCRRQGRAYPCGEVARDALAALTSAGPVRCRAAGRDRYGRILARCGAREPDLGAVLVSRGLAVAYGDYAREEAAARARSDGLWAGEFERPDLWRRRRS